MDFRRTIRFYYDYVIPSYTRTPVVIERGKNAKLWDAEGKEYLDFFSGYAVSNVGHRHPRVVKALKQQLDRLIHIPNTFYHDQQALLAKKIITHSFPGKVFFSNSGAESVEGAIKLARRFGNPDRYEIITMENSFHGRTYGALSATGQATYKKGFGPLLPGFQTVPFNDCEALERAVTPKTAAVLLELVQGEGGVHVAHREYVQFARRLCDTQNILLIFDEVQTGMGRTGKIFCYKNYEIEPDVMLLAKSLAGGVPMGAVIASTKVCDVLQAGSHASTFGGGPLACAAALAVFEAIEKERLAQNAFVIGSYLVKKLHDLKNKHEIIKEVRGLGLLVGAELSIEGESIYKGCLEKGLVINVAQQNVLRFAPPLTISEKEVDHALAILDEVLVNVGNSQGSASSASQSGKKS